MISGGTGTWRTVASSGVDPCIGRKVPISVQSSTADELKISLYFSKALTGCSDSKVEFKRTDDSMLKGKRGKQDPIAVRH